MTSERPHGDSERVRLRRTTVRVLLVQAISMAVLWLLHARYHAG